MAVRRMTNQWMTIRRLALKSLEFVLFMVYVEREECIDPSNWKEFSGGYQAGHANKFTISLRQSSTFDIFLLLN